MFNHEQPPRRVLLITRNLPPLRGGMERLIHRMAQSLAADFCLTVVGPKGCSTFLLADDVIEVEHRSLFRFLLSTAIATLKASRLHRFDLVFAGSGLTAPFAWWAAHRSGARWGVYLHGLDVIAPSIIYRRFWLPFLRRADVALVNSGNTRRLAMERGVSEQAIMILPPGTELPGPDLESRNSFRAEHGLVDKRAMLSVGRLTPRKGLVRFIGEALPLVLLKYPDAILLVIGADASDAAQVSAVSEREQIIAAAKNAGVTAAVKLLPPCDDATLSAAYRAADAYVFPVLDLPGDVEGFGMVAIEAAAHGLSTVGFRVGGVPDAIVEGVTGSLVEPGNYENFAAQVCFWLSRSGQSQSERACASAAGAFSWDRFDERLRDVVRSMVEQTCD